MQGLGLGKKQLKEREFCEHWAWMRHYACLYLLLVVLSSLSDHSFYWVFLLLDFCWSCLETSLSCTATDFKKIAPGWENCAEVVRRTLPARVPGDSEKMCKNCAWAPFFAQKLCKSCARTIFTQFWGEMTQRSRKCFCTSFAYFSWIASCTGNKCLKSCRRCLLFLVLEPLTDHAESCEVITDHANSCSWKKCLKVPDFAWKCLILFSENGRKCLKVPDAQKTLKPRNKNLFQWADLLCGSLCSGDRRTKTWHFVRTS